MVKVKICGITNYEDAALALDLGADALGFNFYPQSSRYITPEDARQIIGKLPPIVVNVGVFVNEKTANDVVTKANIAGVDCLQLHGYEPPQFCSELQMWSVIKSFRLTPDFNFKILDSYSVSAFLLDAYDEKRFGGTGKTADWNLAVQAKKFGKIILAGGLNSRNVASAIQFVVPYGVDVCSGVEIEPGKKDRTMLQAFMYEVERARREIKK
jgi:phosphoribosylanthranilate isomerase